MSFAAGFATDGLSAVFKQSLVRLPLTASGAQALKVLGTGVIAGDAGIASTALLNKLQCRNDSLAITAFLSAGSGAMGANVTDALFKFPSAGTVLGTLVSGGPAFIPTEGGASCTCSH